MATALGLGSSVKRTGAGNDRMTKMEAKDCTIGMVRGITLELLVGKSLSVLARQVRFHHKISCAVVTLERSCVLMLTGLQKALVLRPGGRVEGWR